MDGCRDLDSVYPQWEKKGGGLSFPEHHCGHFCVVLSFQGSLLLPVVFTRVSSPGHTEAAVQVTVASQP